jgi:IS605 OrfB family transposase
VGIRTTIRDLQTQRKHQVGLRNDDNLIIIQEEIDRIDNAIKEERKKITALPAQKNQGVREWELLTPKEVRAGAVDDVCKAMKTGFSNLKNGNIRHFRLNFKKQTEPDKCMLVPKSFVTNFAGSFQIAPMFFKEHSKFHIGKRTKKKHGGIEINYDTRIVRQKKTYWIVIPVPQSKSEKRKPVNYCGVDPGVRTFMTTFGNNGVSEYKHRAEALRELDRKIRRLQYSRVGRKNRIRKKRIEKVEYRKANMVNELHWKTINNLTKKNDFIFYGNINSHSIVKNGKNHILNQDVNNLKFYQFKMRLLFKAQERGCKVHLVHEAYTSKTCSFCGCLTNVGDSKIYTCRECKQVVDRDINASKNILMKGIITSV